MKNFVRLAVAAAIATGFSAGAFAQLGPATPNVPSNGGPADLWVFVSDPGAQDTFAVDTGISVSSVQPTTYTSSAATGTILNDSNGFASVTSSALASFVTNSADASSLTYAVEAIQYNGFQAASPNDQPAGKEMGVFSVATTTDPSKVTNLQFGNLATWSSGFNGDVTYLLNGSPNGYAQGGSTFNWSDGSVGGNVWGAGGAAANTNTGGSTNLYGQGGTQAGVGLGTAASLYTVTGNGDANGVQAYSLGTVTVGTDGSITDTVAPVPLPAAVWLFGSGLLGLFGVGRRRSA